MGSMLLVVVSPTRSEVLPTIINTQYHNLIGINRIGDGHSATKWKGTQAGANVIARCAAMRESCKSFTVLDDRNREALGDFH